jgi:CobQ-like glutamine amidotransferase family enzyme
LLYLKALEELKKPDEATQDAIATRAGCHNRNNQHFDGTDDPNSLGNLLEGMKQALEDRNFRVLYLLINRALEAKSQKFQSQIYDVRLSKS